MEAFEAQSIRIKGLMYATRDQVYVVVFGSFHDPLLPSHEEEEEETPTETRNDRERYHVKRQDLFPVHVWVYYGLVPHSSSSLALAP